MLRIGVGRRGLLAVLFGLVVPLTGQGLHGGSVAGAAVTTESVRAVGGVSVTCRAQSGRSAVAVVVAFAEAEAPIVRCVELVAGATGIDALRTAGFSLRIESGFICGIDGVPARGCATGSGFDGAYWRYFRAAPGGEWKYATTGAGFPIRTSDGCAVEGWLWSGTSTVSPPAVAPAAISCVHSAAPTTPPTTRPPVPPTAPTTTPSGGGGLPGGSVLIPPDGSGPTSTSVQPGSEGRSGDVSGPTPGLTGDPGEDPGGPPNGTDSPDSSGSAAGTGAPEVEGAQESDDTAVDRSMSSLPSGSPARNTRGETAARTKGVSGGGDDASPGSPIGLVVALSLASGIGVTAVLARRRSASGAN